MIELKGRYNDLKKKKNLEISGYKSEVKALRQEFKRLVRDIEDQRYNESPINATKKVLPKNTRPKTATVKVLKKKKESDLYKNGKKPIYYQDSDIKTLCLPLETPAYFDGWTLVERNNFDGSKPDTN